METKLSLRITLRRTVDSGRLNRCPSSWFRGWRQTVAQIGFGWLVGSALLADPIPPQSDTWANHVRVGVQLGLNLKAEFLATGPAPVSGSQPGVAGPGGLPHSYDDGYVLVDQTGNAEGYTSFWGYQNAAQFDPARQTLTLHSASTSTPNLGTTEDASPQWGVELAYGRDFARWGKARIGWELGLGVLPVTVTDTQPLPTTLTRTVHTFDTAGIVMPTAPYHGGSGGLGPTLHDAATALPDDTIAGSITGSRTLDASLCTVRLGPTLRWEPHRRWAVAASAGFALGILTGDYNFSETIALADGGSTVSRGKVEATDLAYGGYVSALVLFRATDQGDLFIGAQFMPMSDASIAGAGREARLDLGTGFYLTAGFNWPF
jgi:hypothetical protein